MIRIPAAIYGRFDRQMPEDNRTDAEIELDALERRREAAQRERLLKLMAYEFDAVRVEKNRAKAEPSDEREQKSVGT